MPQDQPFEPRDAQELRTLLEISRSLLQFINLNELIAHILSRVETHLDCEAASVILHHEETEEFSFFSADNEVSGLKEKLQEIRFPSNMGIAGRVFMSGRPELIGRVAGDPAHYPEVDRVTGFVTRSMLAVPLPGRGRTIGVVEALNKRKGDFAPGDLAFLVSLSGIIGLALDNAQTHSKLVKAYAEVQELAHLKDSQLNRERERNIRLLREVEDSYRLSKIKGSSARMREVLSLCEKVKNSEITVLIEGETGTGKELIAGYIHYLSLRRDRPFITQNCGAISESLLAGELFGHRKGAFTGATSDKKGLFEVAEGGTIFLDEVGEMSPAMQTALLRVLQEGEVKPVGATQAKKVNVRVLSATNRSLRDDVAAGRFREDLYYRLNAFVIQAPPLRERQDDVPILARHFAREFAKRDNKFIRGISEEAMRQLMAQRWPGNVRELENEIERAVVMAENGGLIEPRHLSDRFQTGAPVAESGAEDVRPLKEAVEEYERGRLVQALARHGGNRSRAAAELGLSRFGLLKKLRRYGLETGPSAAAGDPTDNQVDSISQSS